MNWSRLAGAVLDAVVVSFTVGAVLSPPDPFTQLQYAIPAFLATLPVVYRYGRQSGTSWWRRSLVFGLGVLAVAVAWRALAVAVGPESAAGVRPAFLLAGVLFGAWLAYFGGLERLRGGPEVSEA